MQAKVIHTKHLFPALDEKLIELLRSLRPEEWKLTTRAKLWSVKDVATHLLDGNIRTLSISRDKYFGDAPEKVDSYESLVRYLNRLNADWVKASARLSPTVLIDLLETTGKEYCDHIQALDLDATAVFSVGWAGEETSANWFHIAREYTEKWHHQQQIREAVAQPGIESQALYQPVLETFMRALPYHFGKFPSLSSKASVKITIEGDAGGTWQINNENGRWLFVEETHHADTTIQLHQNHAWKLFTKGLPLDHAITVTTIVGDEKLGEHFLKMLSVMA